MLGVVYVGSSAVAYAGARSMSVIRTDLIMLCTSVVISYRVIGYVCNVVDWFLLCKCRFFFCFSQIFFEKNAIFLF